MTDQPVSTPPAPTEAATAPLSHRPGGALHIVEVVQTILIGLILAFMMRAFLVEPFIIPTGSMAHSLLGAHATRTCPACGWEYDFAPKYTATPAGEGFVRPDEILCPNCQLRLTPTAADTVPKAGDRILVHKWPYALGLFPPRRWDVIVFRDPADPEQHYIKRVVGLPGESIEIIDGDLFIDGRIARKPVYAQDVLWSIVFDQGHLPLAAAASGQAPRWVAREPMPPGLGWMGLDTRVIRYAADDDQPRTLVFNADAGLEYLQDLYAYNRRASGVFVGDVRLVAELTFRRGAGWCRWEILRPPDRFSLVLHAAGGVQLRLSTVARPEFEVVVGTWQRAPFSAAEPVALEFGHVDYRVYARLNGAEVLATSEDDYAPVLEELRAAHRMPAMGLRLTSAAADLELRGLRIERDVHYTRTAHTRRATPGEPFVLAAGEYFALGDNSPDSHDSREWTGHGPHLPDDYRPGTVWADQIVGQAAFVYLPGLLPLDGRGRWFIPDLGRVRFIR